MVLHLLGIECGGSLDVPEAYISYSKAQDSPLVGKILRIHNGVVGSKSLARNMLSQGGRSKRDMVIP